MTPGRKGKRRVLGLPAGMGLAAGLLALLAWQAAFGAQPPAGQPKHVLILQSFGRDVAPWNGITPVFKTELARQLPVPVEFHELAVETARQEEPQAASALAEYLRTLYLHDKPDLVVPVGAAAAQFWWQYRPRVFPAVPVVIGGIESRWLTLLPLGSNDTAVTFRFDLNTGPEDALQLFPATTNVFVVAGDSMLERFWAAEGERAWAAYSNRVQLVWLNKLPFSEMCGRAAALPPRSILVYGMLWVDVAGVPYEQMKALDQLQAVANAPMFGLLEDQLGHGIIGGRLLSSATIGRETARVAQRMLEGGPAAKIPSPVITTGPPTFDWRELQRWHVDERRLPPGSVVLFRQPSVWERYRWYVGAVAGIILLQALTIVALVAQRRWRRRAEAELSASLKATHAAELAAQRHRNELLQIGRAHVLGHLSTALAHELNQPLGAILSNAEAAELLLRKDPPPWDDLREILADIRKDDLHAGEVIRRMRELLGRRAMELKPLRPDELIAECLALVRTDAAERRVRLESQVQPGTPAVNGDRVHLEQVLLNLLLNAMDAMREVPAERRRVWLRAARQDDGKALFSVEDTGAGIQAAQLERIFEPFHTTKPNGLGVGLSISRTIIEAHHGRIWAENSPSGGAIIRFSLPVSEAAAGNGPSS